MEINFFLILGVLIGMFIFGSMLYYKKWKLKNIVSLCLSLLLIFLFVSYGPAILMTFWKTANASDLWLISMFFIYLVGFFGASFPFFLDGKVTKKEFKKMGNIAKILLITLLLFSVLDNILYGPYAVGVNSPYVGQDLCSLNPTFISIDSFIGCQIQRLGFDPFNVYAGLFAYAGISILVILLSASLIGFKKLEKMIYKK